MAARWKKVHGTATKRYLNTWDAFAVVGTVARRIERGDGGHWLWVIRVGDRHGVRFGFAESERAARRAADKAAGKVLRALAEDLRPWMKP